MIQASKPRAALRLSSARRDRSPRTQPAPAQHGESTRRPGIPPSELVGKVLTSIRASKAHPTVTLHFADRSAFQIRVDGYSPAHPGVPKTIETSPELAPLLAAARPAHAGYTVARAAVITMTDRAFQRRGGGGASTWEQRHAGVAFQFSHEERWHCVWAALEEYDDAGRCTFKSFHDVYLERLAGPPSQHRQRRSRSPPQARQASAGTDSCM